MEKDIKVLSSIIMENAKEAFEKLFQNKEHYYYCVLLTTEEGFPPCISAWSWEALEKLSKERGKEYAQIRKWSYADSPFYNFGEDCFTPTKILFEQRPTIDSINEYDWEKELKIRLKAMELAMKQLSKDGIFSITQPRESIYINVELMPPTISNTERALRLNKKENIIDWLNEAAEE